MKRLPMQDQERLNALYRALLEKRKTYIGYPNSHLLNNESLAKFLDLMINNVGDPFRGNNGLNTCELEIEVVNFMGELLNLKKEERWGYVTNGGTEGNMYGLYLARETFPKGILYFSQDSHYSIPKAGRLLGIKSSVIQSQPNGEMDYGHFDQVIRSSCHYPVIVSANVGTTMKGAIDDLDKILGILQRHNVKDFYIHCDAALFGAMLPFVPNAPPFDFRAPVGSLAVSGHKFLGSPIPCGIVMARQSIVEKVCGTVEYIGSVDSTISGSRDGFSVLILWQTIKRYGIEGLRELVRYCEDTTSYALDRLKEMGWVAWANACSNIIVIDRPEDWIVKKWQLAPEGKIAHLIIMPGITRSMVDTFVSDLSSSQMKESVQRVS